MPEVLIHRAEEDAELWIARIEGFEDAIGALGVSPRDAGQALVDDVRLVHDAVAAVTASKVRLDLILEAFERAVDAAVAKAGHA